MTHDDLAWFQWEPPVKLAVSLTWQWAHSVFHNKPVSRTPVNGVLRAGVFRRLLFLRQSTQVAGFKYSSTHPKKRKRERKKSRKTRVPGRLQTSRPLEPFGHSVDSFHFFPIPTANSRMTPRPDCQLDQLERQNALHALQDGVPTPCQWHAVPEW